MDNLSPYAPWLQNQTRREYILLNIAKKWLTKWLFLKNFKMILSQVTVDHPDMMGRPGTYQPQVLQMKIQKIQHQRRIQVLSVHLHPHREAQVFHLFQIYNQQLCELPLQRRGIGGFIHQQIPHQAGEILKQVIHLFQPPIQDTHQSLQLQQFLFWALWPIT